MLEWLGFKTEGYLMTQMAPYDRVAKSLASLSCQQSPAEIHAFLVAMLSVGVGLNEQAWLNSIISHDSRITATVMGRAKKVLGSLFSHVSEELREDVYNIELLLPSDEADIALRIEALAQWASAYITAVNLIGVDLQTQENQELVEALADMTNIACLSPQQEETGNQDDEKAFVQLVEYARVCVMMLHTEHQGKTLKINRKMVH